MEMLSLQIRELRAMANAKQIELDIQKGQKTLKIAGISKNVMDFTDKVQRYVFHISKYRFTLLQKK